MGHLVIFSHWLRDHLLNAFHYWNLLSLLAGRNLFLSFNSTVILKLCTHTYLQPSECRPSHLSLSWPKLSSFLLSFLSPVERPSSQSELASPQPLAPTKYTYKWTYCSNKFFYLVHTLNTIYQYDNNTSTYNTKIVNKKHKTIYLDMHQSTQFSNTNRYQHTKHISIQI